MKFNEISTYNLKSQHLLTESWNILTESQKLHISKWEHRVWPLMEKLNILLENDLSNDQIQQIFQNAEEVAMSGDNKTALGRAGKAASDITGKIKQEIQKLYNDTKNSQEVQEFDQQFEDLKKKIKDKLAGSQQGQKVISSLDKWKKFGKDHPVKTAFIIGAMTSLLAFASGGVMSGAAIGFFIRTANNIIQGDKLSTAIGKGATGAAIGAVAGAIGDILSDPGAVEISEPEFENGPQTVSSEISSDQLKQALSTSSAAQDQYSVQSPGSSGIDNPQDSSQTTDQVNDLLPDSLDEYKLEYANKLAEHSFGAGKTSDAMIQKMADLMTVEGSYPDNFSVKSDFVALRSMVLSPEEHAAFMQFIETQGNGDPYFSLSSEAREWMIDNVEGAKEEYESDQALAAQEREQIRKSRSDTVDPRVQQQLDSFFDSKDLQEYYWDQLDLYEAGFKDTLKSAGGKIAGKAQTAAKSAASKTKKAAQGAGKELGNRVTFNKLNRMWKKAGSPSDIASIVNILIDAGLTDEQVGTVGTNNNVDLAAAVAQANPPRRDDSEIYGNRPRQQAASDNVQASSQDSLESLATEIINSGMTREAIKYINQKLSVNSKPGDKRQNNYMTRAKNQMRNLNPSTGGKKLPTKLQRSLNRQLQLFKKGDTYAAIKAAKRIVIYANKGYDISKFHEKWIQNLSVHGRIINQSLYFDLDNILTEFNYSWQSFGVSVMILEDHGLYHIEAL